MIIRHVLKHLFVPKNRQRTAVADARVVPILIRLGLKPNRLESLRIRGSYLRATGQRDEN